MASVYSVSRVNRYISGLFTEDFALSKISVKGEVSNCKYHPSGHIYFTLKDEGSALSAVLFAGNRSGLTFRMENGQQVIVTGRIQVYERAGSYQLYASQIRQDGQGDLYLRFQEQKKYLEEMGMFSEAYKQPIPPYIQTLGVVTASTGAAVRDIIQITKRRNPFVQILLYPALVQGDGAAESICKGIRTLDGRVDCMIVGRGGGSMEDLWAFNEESVARAIFDCETPIISAVGHETDITIADFVADLRAPTPSAAAELAVYSVEDLSDRLQAATDRMRSQVQWNADRCRKMLAEQARRLVSLHPESRMLQNRQYLAEVTLRLEQRMQQILAEKKHQLELLAGRLEAQSPLKRLGGGYTYTRTASGQALTSVVQVASGDRLGLILPDGEIRAVVEEKTEYGKKNVD